MSAPNDPFLLASTEAELLHAARVAGARAARADHGAAPVSADEAREMLLDWLGAYCDASPLWDWEDWVPGIRERVLDAAWEAYQVTQAPPRRGLDVGAGVGPTAAHRVPRPAKRVAASDGLFRRPS